MNDSEANNLALVRRFLAALQAGASGAELRQFFTDDARHVALPNKINPTGGESDLANMLKRSEQGKKLMSEQRYEILSELARDDRAAVEARWTGILAVPFGTLPAGAAMRATFAMFFEFSNGRIRLQRNYDCFEPW